VDEDVPDGIEAGFPVLYELAPRQFTESLEESMVLSIVIRKKVSYVNHYKRPLNDELRSTITFRQNQVRALLSHGSLEIALQLDKHSIMI